MSISDLPPLDCGLACLLIVARLHGVAADPDAILHRYARPGRALEEGDLVRAARWLGLRSTRISSRWSRLPGAPLPALAATREGWFVIARATDTQVLVQDPRAEAPQVLERAEFEGRWTGSLILVTRRAAVSRDDVRFGFGWFLPEILKYRGLLEEVLVASLFLQLFALATPVFFQIVIDKVLVHRGVTTLDVAAIGLVCVSLFEVLLGGLRTYLLAHTTHRIDAGLGVTLFRHLLRLPLAYFEARRVGDSVARVRELDGIRAFLTGSALTLAVDTVFASVFLLLMWCYSPRLCGVVLATIPCYVLLAAAVTPILRMRLNERFDRGAESQAFLVESIAAIGTVKAAAVEPQVEREWEERLAAHIAAGFRATQIGNLAQQLCALIQKLATVAVLWLGARLVMDQSISVGQLVAFNMFAGRISTPILRLVQLWQDFQQAAISVRRLGDILNAAPEPASTAGRSALPRLDGRVAFESVSFRYRPDRPEVLRRVTFDVDPGQVVGIVGRSGSGKSTLATLIQRLHVPEGGRVRVDGVDLALVDPASLRRQIGVVLQENVLFDRSVRDNIALREPTLRLERIIHAAKLACAHEFILELPEGYDTVVGEHGARISGGQRQRIAIARALATDPRILVFDEATSALDYESEAALRKNLRGICEGRTVFLIAHRLALLQDADRILVLDRGELVEQGTHRDLLGRRGHYAGLFRHQAVGG